MPLFYSFIFIGINLFAQVELDRVYTFLEHSLTNTKTKNFATINAGILVESSTTFNDADISGSVRILHNDDEEKKDSLDIKELYLQHYYDDDRYLISIGKQTTDFSVTKTHTVVDFFSKKNAVTNSSDKSLEQLGNDGINMIYEDEYKIALYSYDVNKGESNTVIELSKTFDKQMLAFFINQNLKAAVFSASVNDYFNFNSEINYENSKTNSVFGIDYTPSSEVLITLEQVYINKNEKSQEFSNIYLKHEEDDLESSFYISLNNKTQTKTYQTKLKYEYDSYSFELQYLVNKYANNSGNSQNLMENKLLFHISWEYL